jgi:hypothetical protein
MAVVDGQTLGQIQVVETLEPHLQILSAAADKAACPPLVGVEGVVVVRFRSHNKPGHEMRHQCTRISSRHIRTGMYVSRVDLT